jgi:hypothetical protein
MFKLKASRAGLSAPLMLHFAGRIMRALGNHRGARSISLALGAGLLAFEAVLALYAGGIGIPGVLLVRFADERGGTPFAQERAPEGGESVVAKLSMPPPAAAPTPAAAPAGEPRLDGLVDIPLPEWIAPKPTHVEVGEAAAAPRVREELPWDAVEPVPFHPSDRASLPAHAAAALLSPAGPATPLPPIALPADGAAEAWVKAKATEVKGPQRARPLYHFEFWLEPPEEVKRRLVAVAYEFNTPAVMPQAQMSREKATGFRVSAGGLTCADKVTVTLKFNDGSSQQVAVDGCRLLG